MPAYVLYVLSHMSHLNPPVVVGGALHRLMCCAAGVRALKSTLHNGHILPFGSCSVCVAGSLSTEKRLAPRFIWLTVAAATVRVRQLPRLSFEFFFALSASLEGMSLTGCRPERPIRLSP